MFKSVSCTLELAKFFGRDYLEFSTSVRFECEKRLHPYVKFDLYSYSTGDTVYYFGIRWQKFIPHAVIACCLGLYVEKDYLAGFKIFSKTVELLESGEKFLFIGDEHFAEAILPLCEEAQMGHKKYPTINYYISEEQEKKLMAAEPLPLPEGYKIGQSRIEDAALITKCWRHKAEGEEDQTRLKIASFPSTCVFYEGEAVAFELVNACGMLTHLYVNPQHRGKNLGHIVQEDMARRLIKQGLYVFKSVETFNKSVIRGTDKWELWTMKKKPDGSPMIKMFMDVFTKN